MTTERGASNHVSRRTSGSHHREARAESARPTVRMFVAAGARVVFNYVRASVEAEKLVAECGADVCHAVQADLNGTAGAEKLVRSAIEHFGGLDALVVNHGIWLGDDVDVDEMTDEQWHTTIATNLDSAFALIKHAVAQMKQQARGGNIVLISSTAGQRGEAGTLRLRRHQGRAHQHDEGTFDGACAVWHSRELRRPGMGGHGHDGRTRSAMPERRKKIFATIPVGRVATPEEIAAPILFLCTRHAGFITGEVFNVNGGAVLVG